MDFGRYLVHTRRLTKDEYFTVVREQVERSFAHTRSEHAADGSRQYVLDHLFAMTQFDLIREHAFGDVLMTMPLGSDVERRAGKSFVQLVQEWQAWHRDYLEPISIYSMASKFGSLLYTQQYEKKIVAQYVVSAPVRGGRPIIGDDDIVLILEGTSGSYVGLAIAAFRNNVTVHTSNNALIREYRDNPAVAQRLLALHTVGGLADFDQTERRSEHGGVSGLNAHDQFEKAMTVKPPATVVVMTVSGLLPDDGPYVSGPCRGLKRSIIELSLQGTVRELIFVADYTKHGRRKPPSYGMVMFHRDEWKKLVETYRSKISIVTTPPPALRARLHEEQFQDVQHRELLEHAFPDVDREYARVAKDLCAVTGGTRRAGAYCPWVHEAYRFVLPREYDPDATQVERSQPAGRIASYNLVFDLREFKHERFVAALGALPPGDLEKVAVETHAHADTTHVSVSAPVPVLNRILMLSVSESQSPEAAEFKRRLSAELPTDAVSTPK